MSVRQVSLMIFHDLESNEIKYLSLRTERKYKTFL